MKIYWYLETAVILSYLQMYLQRHGFIIFLTVISKYIFIKNCNQHF